MGIALIVGLEHLASGVVALVIMVPVGRAQPLTTTEPGSVRAPVLRQRPLPWAPPPRVSHARHAAPESMHPGVRAAAWAVARHAVWINIRLPRARVRSAPPAHQILALAAIPVQQQRAGAPPTANQDLQAHQDHAWHARQTHSKLHLALKIAQPAHQTLVLAVTPVQLQKAAVKQTQASREAAAASWNAQQAHTRRTVLQQLPARRAPATATALCHQPS